MWWKMFLQVFHLTNNKISPFMLPFITHIIYTALIIYVAYNCYKKWQPFSSVYFVQEIV